MDSDEPLPPFAEAVEGLIKFLADSGYPTDICWLCRDDLFRYHGRTFVRWPLPAENAGIAESTYSTAMARGHGVRLLAECRVRHKVCAYVIAPEDAAAAEWMMIQGLRWTIIDPLRQATAVPAGWCWSLLMSAMRGRPDYQDWAVDLSELPERPR